jgi:hypothetical protein
MTDDKLQPNQSDRPEQARPKRLGDDAQEHQAAVLDAPAQGGQPPAPGRKPLFRS